jgi:hypothetical protein
MEFYFPYFESRLRYGIIFWGGTGKRIIVLLMPKKKVIRLITGVNELESCRQKFKDMKILMVALLYVLEVLCFIKDTRVI